MSFEFYDPRDGRAGSDVRRGAPPGESETTLVILLKSRLMSSLLFSGKFRDDESSIACY